MNTMKNLYYWATFLLFFLALPTQAQITASDSTGCAPLVGVVFTAPPGASNPFWDFDDGAFASSLSPSHTFGSAGTYNVVFTGTVGGNPVTENLTIEVYAKPIPDYIVVGSSEGCVPLNVTFQDQSTGQLGATIVGWEWAFGDGGVNLVNNPSPNHTYVLPGQYDVSLKVIDSNGCDTLTVHTDEITVSNPPNIVLSSNPNPPVSCTVPFDVDFDASGSTSNSPVGNGLTFEWDFGNGDNANVATPTTITYDSAGHQYTVSVMVTDDNNCTATATTVVQTHNPQAGFYVDGAINDTVCSTILIVDTAASGGIITYDYGDGTTGTDTFHTYTAPGNYTVTQLVTSGPCTDIFTVDIVVEEILASFNSGPNASCMVPFPVQFNNTSVGAVSWEWHFGDGTVDSVNWSPLHNLNLLDTNQYTIWDTVFFNDTLIVTSFHGCVDTVVAVNNDTLFPPNALFMPDIHQCCVGVGILFSDSSMSVDPIVSWEWHFGDGNTSNLQNPVYAYAAPGIYDVFLVIETAQGCIDTSFVLPMIIGAPPGGGGSGGGIGNVLNGNGPIEICAGQSFGLDSLFNIQDSSQVLNLGGSPFFNSSCPGTGSTGEFTFCGGWHDLDVSLGGWTGGGGGGGGVATAGCGAVIDLDSVFFVTGPSAYVNASMECSDTYTFNFTADTSGADHWEWDFGDGTVVSNSTDTAISHTYGATGDYVVYITSYQDSSTCGPFVDSMTVYVRDVEAIFAHDTIACVGDSMFFDASQSVDVHEECFRGYTWYWGAAGPPWLTGEDTTHVIYDTAGYFDVTLVVFDRYGCCDSASSSVQVYGIEAIANATPAAGCVPLDVYFEDQSTSDTTIISWDWSIDGTSQATTDTMSYTFNSAGNFEVILTVESELGCVDQDTLLISPSEPSATFNPGLFREICVGDSIQFTNTGTQGTHFWDFGDGGTSTDENPWHTFNTVGDFDIIHTVTDAIGCIATETKYSFIRVQGYPDAGFYTSIDSLDNTCYPILINFFDTSTANVFDWREWELGVNNPIVPSQTVGWLFDQPGSYDISLIVSTTYGCVDTATRTVVVDGPTADFSVGPTICQGGTVTFDMTDTVGVETWFWDFGDGTDTTAVDPVDHTYNFVPPGGSTMASLTIWGQDSTCAATISHPVYIHEVVADFTLSDSVLCGSENLYITDNSTNVSLSNYQWDLGDGTMGLGALPGQHHYAGPGVYPITLIASDDSTGCADTTTYMVEVFPLPVVEANGGVICQVDSVPVSATGAISYEWVPAIGIGDPTAASTMAGPSQTTVYTVIGEDVNGCTATDTALVLVLQPAPVTVWDTTIVIGEVVNIGIDYGPLYNYVWNPTTYLSCPTCPVTVAQPLVDMTYDVTISDIYGCYTSNSTYIIYVDPETTCDLPSAFNPGNDGPNSVLYVRGWGLKELEEFKIYNRWGEVVYENPGDLSQGWDGYYKGVLQNPDNYVYSVVVKTYTDETLTLSGTVTLIR